MSCTHDIRAGDLGLGPATALTIDITCGCLSGSGHAIRSFHEVLVVVAVGFLKQSGGPLAVIENCCLAMYVGRMLVDLRR